jgi:DNA mismatch endonuclease, patch repair protein
MHKIREKKRRMTDRVSRMVRHRIMSANRSTSTSPEVEVRKALHREGFRYRISPIRVLGRPDIVLAKYRLAIFVHGCFWHGHRCRRRPESQSNRMFWRSKIVRNRKRDQLVRKSLLKQGWRVLIIWECAIRRKTPPFAKSDQFKQVCRWISSSAKVAVLSETGFDEIT